MAMSFSFKGVQFSAKPGGRISFENDAVRLSNIEISQVPNTSITQRPSPPAPAATNVVNCSTTLTVHLETFGDNVMIELRQGTAGDSRVVDSQRSSGGNVYFRTLRHGSYFMAIGNEDDVSVTPVRQFEDNTHYESNIVVQRGAGNVTRKSRRAL